MTKKPARRSLVAGKPVSEFSDRPPVWHALADRLLSEGWLWDAGDACEWVHGKPHPVVGGVGYELSERGRICWTPEGDKAWLRHPSSSPDDRLTDSHVLLMDASGFAWYAEEATR